MSSPDKPTFTYIDNQSSELNQPVDSALYHAAYDASLHEATKIAIEKGSKISVNGIYTVIFAYNAYHWFLQFEKSKFATDLYQVRYAQNLDEAFSSASRAARNFDKAATNDMLAEVAGRFIRTAIEKKIFSGAIIPAIGIYWDIQDLFPEEERINRYLEASDINCDIDAFNEAICDRKGAHDLNYNVSVYASNAIDIVPAVGWLVGPLLSISSKTMYDVYARYNPDPINLLSDIFPEIYNNGVETGEIVITDDFMKILMEHMARAGDSSLPEYFKGYENLPAYEQRAAREMIAKDLVYLYEEHIFKHSSSDGLSFADIALDYFTGSNPVFIKKSFLGVMIDLDPEAARMLDAEIEAFKKANLSDIYITTDIIGPDTLSMPSLFTNVAVDTPTPIIQNSQNSLLGY